MVFPIHNLKEKKNIGIKLKPWPNGLASRRKFWTCVELAFPLATHLRGLALTLVELKFGRKKAHVDASFLLFGHPA